MAWTRSRRMMVKQYRWHTKRSRTHANNYGCILRIFTIIQGLLKLNVAFLPTVKLSNNIVLPTCTCLRKIRKWHFIYRRCFITIGSFLLILWNGCETTALYQFAQPSKTIFYEIWVCQFGVCNETPITYLAKIGLMGDSHLSKFYIIFDFIIWGKLIGVEN